MSTPAPNPPPPDRRSPFEWSLAALRPADADVARPSFMFKAGQASRQKAVWFWRCVAGGLAVLMVAGGIAAVGVIQGQPLRAGGLPGPVPAPAVVTAPPAPTGEPVPVVSARPVSTRPATVAEDPSASEIAAALERRRNILVGGLGLIPDPPPPVRTLSPGTPPTYPGVFATPRTDPSPVTDPGDPR